MKHARHDRSTPLFEKYEKSRRGTDQERFAQRLIDAHITAGQDHGGPDASPREPQIFVAGDPLPVGLTRSRTNGGAR
jgi:hypothetical protein